MSDKTIFILVPFVAIVVMVSAVLLFQGCNLIEVNMVQRAVIEDGEGISHRSLETNLEEENNQMELVVPLR